MPAPRLVRSEVALVKLTLQVEPEVLDILKALAARKRVTVPHLLGAYVTALAVRSTDGKRRRLYLDPLDMALVDE